MQAILFMGIQGSGKTTFYKERFVNTHLRISLDVLRTRHREKKIFECCLATGTRIVIDNTNPGTVDRHRYIGPAKQAGYEIVGYYFAADLPRSIERNESRGGREVVPRKGVMATYKKLEPPSYGEGFDRLFSVAVDPRGGFQVEEWHE
jgi:predicted kinase